VCVCVCVCVLNLHRCSTHTLPTPHTYTSTPTQHNTPTLTPIPAPPTSAHIFRTTALTQTPHVWECLSAQPCCAGAAGRKHTHVHTHTHTYAHAHTHSHAHTRTRTRTCTHTQATHLPYDCTNAISLSVDAPECLTMSCKGNKVASMPSTLLSPKYKRLASSKPCAHRQRDSETRLLPKCF